MKTKKIVCPICNTKMEVTIHENPGEINIDTTNCKHNEDDINKKEVLEEIMNRINNKFYD